MTIFASIGSYKLPRLSLYSMNIRQLILTFLLLFSLTFVSAQDYKAPLNIPPSLSANFGELRNNHFHSGLDYRTQYAVNKPIFAIEDGYVSRINISPTGYGLALYIDHPTTGHTSVYGHLNSFSKKIQEYAVQKQYELEAFRIDISLQPDELPVKKGEQIALSGNTGSSGGPHLHFEIRDTKSEEPMDPLQYFGHTITDNVRPDLRGIAIYPQYGKAVVNGSVNPIRMNIGKGKNGLPLQLPQRIRAWGVIGLGVKAYDLMNGTTNIYGVRNIKLFVDDEKVFESTIDRFSFDESRMINSFIDFEDWRLNRSFFMKSFVEPGNRLKFYESKENGYIHINKEKTYNLRYELTDTHGNRTSYSFVIEGVKQNIPEPKECRKRFSHLLSNSFLNDDIALFLPTNSLYDDCCFNYSRVASTNYLSDIHQIHSKPVALYKNALLKIAVKDIAEENIPYLGVMKIDRAGKSSWVGGSYKEGFMEVEIRELGDKYAIGMDKTAPLITPISPAQWKAKRQITIQLKDERSGIQSFRGEINGQFVLFKHDTKSPNYTYTFDDTRLSRGTQNLLFKAVDNAGNESVYTYQFEY